MDTCVGQLHWPPGSMLHCQDVCWVQWEQRLLTLILMPTSANLQIGVPVWSCVTVQTSHLLFHPASLATVRNVIRGYRTGISLLISHQTSESEYITPTSLHSQQRYLCLDRLIHPINSYLRKVEQTAVGKCLSLSTKYKVSLSNYFRLDS